jgi:16S rRNA (uracil1498-N3)-methyltransferase
MRIPHIFTEHPLTLQQPVTLTKAKSHHLSQVLRLKPGHPITIFNQQQQAFAGIIQSLSKNEVTILPEKTLDLASESPLKLTLAQGLCQSNKMDWIVQKATELGVFDIIPIISEHTTIKLSPERLQKKLAHWQAIAISAAEQSKRLHVPNIHNPSHLSKWLTMDGQKIVLSPQANTSMPKLHLQTTQNIHLLIGPEGGLSQTDTTLCQQQNAHLVRLGPRVLRTETAAIIGIGLCQAYWGDLS